MAKKNTKKIKLFRAVALKKELEERISSIDNLTIKYNTVSKDEDFPFSADELENERELKSELLVDLHVLLEEANLRKSKGESECNAYYIKRLSELRRKQRKLNLINNGNNKGGKTLISVAEANKQLQKILQEISTIEAKLTTFNNSIDVEIEIPEGLDLVLE